jgi:hypothetical protein
MSTRIVSDTASNVIHTVYTAMPCLMNNRQRVMQSAVRHGTLQLLARGVYSSVCMSSNQLQCLVLLRRSAL